MKYSQNFIKAAEAANTTPEKFAEQIRHLLSPSKCRDTSGKVFSASVMRSILSA